MREDRVRRVLSRDRPDVDEGWLCDKGRFAFEHVRADDRYAARRSCAAIAGSTRRAWEARGRDRRARACATTRTCTAPARSPSSPPASSRTRRPSPGARSCEAAGGGALVGSGRPWELLDPYRATIADLDAADVIVVAGDREPRDLAGVIELRIRKAVRRGARLMLAGAGGDAARPARGERIATRPACSSTAPTAIVDRLAAAERPVLLVTDPPPLELVACDRARGRARDKAGRRPAAARGAERARRPRAPASAPIRRACSTAPSAAS